MGPTCGKVKKRHELKSNNFDKQSESEGVSVYQKQHYQQNSIFEDQSNEVKSIKSEAVKSTREEAVTPKPSSSSTKSSPPELVEKIKKKKSRPDLTVCLPIRLNPFNNVIYHKISASELFNALVREMNARAGTKPPGKCEFLDLGSPKSDKRLFRSQYIDAKKLRNFDEKTWKQFKILMDFKKIYVLLDEAVPYVEAEANFLPNKVIKLMDTLTANNVKLGEVLVVVSPVNEVLQEFPFLEEKFQQSLQSPLLYPLLLFDSGDFPELPRSSGTSLRIFIQGLKAFESNASESFNFFKESLAVSSVCLPKSAEIVNSIAAKNKTSQSYKQLLSFDITNIKERQKLANKLANAISKNENILLVYEPDKKDLLLEYIILFGELLDQQLGVGEELGRRYFEARMPNLLKAGRVSLDEKEEKKEQTSKRGQKAKKEEPKEEIRENRAPVNRCDLMYEALCSLQVETSKNFLLIEEIFEKLRFFLDNMIKNPDEPKFKTVKKDNPRLSKTVFLYANSMKLMNLCGFVENPDDLNKLSNYLDATSLKMIKSDMELAYKRLITPPVQL